MADQRGGGAKRWKSATVNAWNAYAMGRTLIYLRADDRDTKPIRGIEDAEDVDPMAAD